MFECIIWFIFPLKIKGQSTETSWTSLAKYNYDPGLQVGDKVDIQDLKMGYWEDKSFSFTAMVVDRRKIIRPNKKEGDRFELAIYLELADKEQLQRMREILKKLNPGKFEENEPEVES